MKCEVFEVTFDCTPVIFGNAESAALAAAWMARGMVAVFGNGKLLYRQCEPTVRRVVIDVPRSARARLAGPARQRLVAPKEGGQA